MASCYRQSPYKAQEEREFCFSFYNVDKIKQKGEIRLTMAILMLISLTCTHILLVVVVG